MNFAHGHFTMSPHQARGYGISVASLRVDTMTEIRWLLWSNSTVELGPLQITSHCAALEVKGQTMPQTEHRAGNR